MIFKNIKPLFFIIFFTFSNFITAYNIEELVPLYKVTPKYPQEAIDKSIGGYVLVDFTVYKDGKIDDLMILESYCAQGNFTNLPEDQINFYKCDIFNETSVKTAFKLRYPPRTDILQGVTHQFTFITDKDAKESKNSK